MYEVLIMSDSHGLTSEVEEIKHRHQLKHMIHCGDSELKYDSSEMQGLHRVAGNCDYDATYPKELQLDIGGLKFFITHGHLHRVNTGLSTIAYRAEEVGAQIVCYGHTHFAQAKIMENQLFINPGSIRSPRGRAEKTYAVLSWQDSNDVTIQYYFPNGQAISDMTYSFNFA